MTGARGQAGYVLLTVLLLVGLIVTTAATYAHHSTASYRTSSASLSIQESRESAQSGLAVAQQLLASGTTSYDAVVASGVQDVQITLGDAGGGVRTLRVEALHQGLGTTLDGQLVVGGALSGPLPQLTAQAALSASRDPDRVLISDGQVLQDTVVDGTLILALGSHCTLRNVVVRGSIVSEAALAGPPYPTQRTTTLTLDGSLRVDGDTRLPGCAIVMPDGELTTLSTSALEIHGVVVAGRIDWRGGGAADGHIVAAQPFSLSATLDRPGYGRTPASWPSSLQLNALSVSRISFPPARPTRAEASAIKRFKFPRS